MAGGKEHAGELGTGARGHGSNNRGHRGVAGVKGNSLRPRARPGNAAGEVAAMAGGKEVDGARGLGARSHETRNKLHGEKEGSTAKLTAGEIEVDGGLKTVVRAEGRTADLGDLRLGSYGFRAR